MKSKVFKFNFVLLSLIAVISFQSRINAAPILGGCTVFPSDNPWNQRVDSLPVHPNSANYINSIGIDDNLHPDFGGNGEYGIPFVTVNGSQPKVPITFTAYGDESDPGPYPIPADAPIEGGESSNGDRHVIVADTTNCKLYELYRAFYNGSGWDADSGAVFDLNSNALRPEGWTSADAAGLPILPGLARYDEVAAGAMNHALRFTVSATQRAYIYPARHYASSSTDPNRPPMGLRLRLKSNYDISGYSGQSRVILETLKKYGMIVADNGSDWFITGASDTRWDDDDLHQLKSVPGSAFEAVDTTTVVPTPVTPELKSVHRFWSEEYRHHFFTINEAEKDYVINNYDDFTWKYEGLAYNAYTGPKSGTSPVYRFWSEKYRSHFYTINEEEKNNVISQNDSYTWHYEGIAFYAYQNQVSGTTPVYRFWSNEYRGHFYTTNPVERDIVISDYPDNVWKYEGIAYYAK